MTTHTKRARRAPEPGFYPQPDGTVALVQVSRSGNWYAIGLRRRPDFSLERTYLGRHTRGLYNPVSLAEATDHLCGVVDLDVAR